jgi:hypothetical protein
MTTRAPSSRKRRAAARPIPLVPPVIITVDPAQRFMAVSIPVSIRPFPRRGPGGHAFRLAG